MPFPIDEQQVRTLESELGARLPACYREFMKANNGGSIELADDDWELHPILDIANRKRICRTASHVMVENKRYLKWHNKAPNTLSIAENGCGDRLILQQEGNKFLPNIFIWSHETGKKTQVAESITEAIRD